MNGLELVFGWIIAASIRASLLSVCIICLQYFLKRWLTPRWKYALWLPVLFVLIAPVLPSSPFGIGWFNGIGVENGVQDTEEEDDGTIKTISDKMIGPVVEVPPPTIATLPGLDLLSVGWLVGFVSVVGLGLFGYQRTIRRIKNQAVSPEQSLIDSASLVAKQISLSYVPQVIVSPAVESPAVTGLFRPILLLPAQFTEGFSESEVRLVLTHELIHLRRRDLPLNWLFSFLLALHWFNPLLWRAFRKIRADREEDCDAQVLAVQSTDSRADYGNALIKMESTSLKTGLSLGFVGIFARSGLRARIVAIARHRRVHPAWALLGVTVIVLLSLVGATQAYSPSASPIPSLSLAPSSSGEDKIQLQMTVLACPKRVLLPGVDDLMQGSIPLNALEYHSSINSTEVGGCLISNAEADTLMKKLESYGGNIDDHSWLLGDRESGAIDIDQKNTHIAVSAFPQLSNGGLYAGVTYTRKVGESLDAVVTNQGSGSTLFFTPDQTFIMAPPDLLDASGSHLVIFVKAHFVNPVTFPPASNSEALIIANIRRTANDPNAMIRVKYDYSIVNGIVVESKPDKIYIYGEWDNEAQHALLIKTAKTYCDTVIDLTGKK